VKEEEERKEVGKEKEVKEVDGVGKTRKTESEERGKRENKVGRIRTISEGERQVKLCLKEV
jgi:hypothetical protein